MEYCKGHQHGTSLCASCTWDGRKLASPHSQTHCYLCFHMVEKYVHRSFIIQPRSQVRKITHGCSLKPLQQQSEHKIILVSLAFLLFLHTCFISCAQHDSNWSVRLVTDATSMFYGARSFNRNLCSWSSQMTNSTPKTGMFFNSGCPFANNDPNYKLTPAGPFCHDCCCRPSLINSVSEPYEVPLIPVGASNFAHTNKILGWSAQSRYQFGGGGGVIGTFTTMFDPDFLNATDRRVLGKSCLVLVLVAKTHMKLMFSLLRHRDCLY
jgi:Mycoplasma protein of unknown function, DUF285